MLLTNETNKNRETGRSELWLIFSETEGINPKSVLNGCFGKWIINMLEPKLVWHGKSDMWDVNNGHDVFHAEPVLSSAGSSDVSVKMPSGQYYKTHSHTHTCRSCPSLNDCASWFM